VGSFITCTNPQISLCRSNQGTRGRGGRSVQVLAEEARREEITRREWDQNGSYGIGWEDLEWIYLAQDRDLWRAVVDTVMNPGVPAPQMS
jgi:hypothetical protein